MKDLSITQEYLLCALNPKGSIPTLNSNRITACIAASGLLELLRSNIISLDAKKKIVVDKTLSAEQTHLEPLYNTIKSGKPMSVNDIAGKYVFATSRRLNEFIEALSADLLQQHCVSAETGGLFRSKTLYKPNSEAVSRVIEKLRAEFLEDGTVQDETVALGALLLKSGLIKDYFSKFESQKLKTRLEEIRNSEAGSLVKEMVDYIDTMVAAMVAVSISHI